MFRNALHALAGSAVILAAFLAVPPAIGQSGLRGLARPDTATVEDRLAPLAPGAARFTSGLMGERILTNRSRLMDVDETDLLDAFERREVDHQIYQGEHVGKFLHAAALTVAATGDPALRAKTARVARRLVATQEADGYLGTYAPADRWTGWDVWVHKYAILGLLAWYQTSGEPSCLEAARRAGDLLIRTFGPGGRDLNEAGTHVGMAATSVLEPICLLYRATGQTRYLDFARRIVDGYDAPGGPRVLSTLLLTGSVYRVANAKAYELLSNLNGLLELYRITGETRLLDAVETAWEDVDARRLYITGTASIGEYFLDDFNLPNGENVNIGETCVTVTWLQMNMHLLRLTGAARYADALERAAFNHLFGSQRPDGRAWCYYTPLEGRKPYGSHTTCCLSSGPRGVALLPFAAAMADDRGGLVVNLYGAGVIRADLPAGPVRLEIDTRYPFSGRVDIRVRAREGARFPLRLRIPDWASGAGAEVNGGRTTHTAAGEYLTLDRAWSDGDTVRLELPMAVRLIKGRHGNVGKAAAMWGPLVLALDTALNPDIRLMKQAAFATDGDTLPGRWSRADGRMVFTAKGTLAAEPNPMPLRLTPFATAGQDGDSRFMVWVARQGRAEKASGSGSLFYGGRVGFSRPGNQNGDIADDDPITFRVTWTSTREDRDWYSVSLPEPARISCVVYMHGRSFNNGGWFDASSGKPEVQVRSAPDAPWRTVATLNAYPDTTATDNRGLVDGQAFSVSFEPVDASAIRIIGAPAHGDSPGQNFTSCAELQAFGPEKPEMP